MCGGHPHADPEHPAEESQRHLFGGNAVECGQRGQHLAGGPDDVATVVHRLIDPLLEGGVELVGLGGEHQHIAGRQTDILRGRGDGYRYLEGTVGRAEQQPVVGKCLRVRASSDQDDVGA